MAQLSGKGGLAELVSITFKAETSNGISCVGGRLQMKTTRSLIRRDPGVKAENQLKEQNLMSKF